MTKGILCTIDFKESSNAAVRWSVELARLLKSPLTILYAYQLDSTGEISELEISELKKQIEENAFRSFSILERDVLEGSGISYDFKVEVGFVSNRIHHYAKMKSLSFLVMGNKMNSISKESFDELAENIQVPLLIVP